MNALLKLLHSGRRRDTSLLAAGALVGVARDRALAHHRTCASCRAEHEALGAALRAVPREEHLWSEPPLPAAALATRVLARVDARAAGARVPRWRLAGAGASVLAGAVVAISMMTSAPPTPEAVPVGEAALSPELLRRIERNVAREQAARYLNDAQDLLVAVASPLDCERPGETLDLSDEAARSRSLLERRALLIDVDHDAVAGARPLMDDVSDVLREVAELPSCVRRSDLRPVQDEIRRRRLIMKADLLARELVG